MKSLQKHAFIAVLSTSLPVLSLSAAPVSMTASDTIGNSSFNTAGHWSNGAAPSAGNDYFTGDFILRTPADSNSYTFAGDSLTVNNANGYPNGLLYKGTGSSGVITINNLILSGGFVSHADGVGDVFQLAGSIDVISNSTIWAKQGEIFINSVISGAGGLTIPQTDAPGEDRRYVHLLANNSSYTGSLTVNGRLDVASDANLGAVPGSLIPNQLTLDGGWLATTNTFALSANRGISLGGSGGTIKVTNPDTNTVAVLTVSGPIGGIGLLDKRGSGVLALSGNNSFSGGLTFDVDAAGSQIDVNSANALGSGTITFNPSTVGPAFLDNTSGGNVTLANNNLQMWQNDITFVGSGNLDMGVGDILMLTNITVAVSNNNLTVGALGDDATVRNLTKTGPGTLTVNGGITFYGDGNTTVSGGVLALVGTSLSGSPVITVSSNATLDVSAAGGLTLTSTLLTATPETLEGGGTVMGNVADDGTGAATINPGDGAPGTLTIDGNLTLNGGSTIDFDLTSSTTVGSGVNDLLVVANQLSASGTTTLNIVGVPTVGTYTLIQYGTFSGGLANFSVPPGYTLTNNTAANVIQLLVTHPPVSLTWQGDGVNNIWDIGTTADWLNSGTNRVFFNGDSVTFDDNGSATPAITLTADVSPVAVTVNASKNYTLKGAGILTGRLTKDGSGTLVLDNTNSYSGPTVINSGVVQVGDWTAPGGGLGGSLGTGNVTNNASLVFSTPVILSVPNRIQGTGALTMNGSGTVALDGSNSYSGLTLVTNGTLEAHNLYALGSTAGVVITNGGRLYLTASADYTNDTTALSIGSGALQRGGGHSLTWGQPIALTGDATFNVDGGATLNYTNPAGLSHSGANLTFAGSGNGNISGPLSLGSGSLTVVGGIWTVAPTNTYTGKTYLSGGRLYVPDLDALGTVPGSPTPDFVTLNGGVLGVATNVTFSGGLRGITVTGTNPGTLFVQNSATVTISGDLYGTGIFQKWQGTLILTGANPFVGTLEVDGGSTSANDGTTVIASPTALSSGVTNIVQRNNNSGYSTLQLDGTAGDITLPQDFQISCRNNDNPNIENVAGNNTLSGSIGVVTGGNRVIYQSDAGLLTLSGTNAFVASATAGRMWVYTGAGDILASGPIVSAASGASIAVVKSGSGQLTLSANNTYNDRTTVNGGVLVVTGSISTTNGMYLMGGGLGGNGTLNDNVTVSNSVPSGTIDALTVNGNFTISGPLAVDVNRSGLQSDEPIVSGAVTNTGGGSIVVNNLGTPLEVNDRFVLFNKAVANGAAMTVTGGGAQWANNLATDGSITVSSVVPTTPTNLTFELSGNTLTLSWPPGYEGWILQAQTNALSVGLSNNWADVSGSGSVTQAVITINPANPAVFYRLRSP